MLFILNPNDSDLSLTDKEDRKLFADGIKGGEESQRFSGEKEKFYDFSKLICQRFKQVRLVEVFKIAKERTGAKPRGPIKVTNILSTKGLDTSAINKHVDLVWASIPFGTSDAEIPDYFASFATAPTKTDELDNLRNKRRLKHIMLGKQTWNSLTPSSNLNS
eukprot:5928906-Ditylum_brightwellii.AAC.1